METVGEVAPFYWERRFEWTDFSALHGTIWFLVSRMDIVSGDHTRLSILLWSVDGLVVIWFS